MATHRISILGAQTNPDASGSVFFEPYSIKAANDVWKHLVAVLNDTATRIGLYGAFTVPQNYVGGAKFIPVWTTTVTTGDVEWDVDYRAVGGDDAESLDQAGTQESLNLNDTAPSAAHERMETPIAATETNFAPGDTVEFALMRDGTDAGDTIAAAVVLHDLLFEYDDA